MQPMEDIQITSVHEDQNLLSIIDLWKEPFSLEVEIRHIHVHRDLHVLEAAASRIFDSDKVRRVYFLRC